MKTNWELINTVIGCDWFYKKYEYIFQCWDWFARVFHALRDFSRYTYTVKKKSNPNRVELKLVIDNLVDWHFSNGIAKNDLLCNCQNTSGKVSYLWWVRCCLFGRNMPSTVQSCWIKSSLDCNYPFQIDLAPHRIPFGDKSIGEEELQSKFVLIWQD